MLMPTKITATIGFLGINDEPTDLSTSMVDAVNVTYAGFQGDSHSGLTRKSCTRVKHQYPVGTVIRNTRQISGLSAEDIDTVRETLQLDVLDATWLGANIVVSGITKFSQLPPSSRLIANNGTALVVDMENAPCRYPGEIIDQHKPGKGKGFAKAAVGRRGVTFWVEREGELKIGDTLSLHVPPACHWQADVL